MCYSSMIDRALKTQFGVLWYQVRMQLDEDRDPRFFPGQRAPFGRLDGKGGREAAVGQFGLVPGWVTDKHGGPGFGRKTYNARSETMFEKPSFRHAARAQRAIVPVKAFFDPPDRMPDKGRELRTSREDGSTFCLGALWEHNKLFGLDSFSIVTSEPMEVLATQHSRSPVIVDEENLEAWLDPATPPQAVMELCRPHASKGYRTELVERGKGGLGGRKGPTEGR